jgi:hypothetical protein
VRLVTYRRKQGDGSEYASTYRFRVEGIGEVIK